MMNTAALNSNTMNVRSGIVNFATINDQNNLQRLDNFLSLKLKGVPKSLIYRIIRKGEVRVNKKRAKAGLKLHVGDIVRIPPVKCLEQKEHAFVPKSRFSALIEASVLFEDNDIIVINKPGGLAVHGGSGISMGLIETLRQLRPKTRFMELVHRIDRETSGCLLIAKKRSVLRHLHAEIRERRVHKDYQLLVAGCWKTKGKKMVDLPLKKNSLSSGERIVKISNEGKPSRTWFKQVEPFADCTLLRAVLDTGRTHQIRVHARSCGHPIAGDEKYGNAEFNKIARSKYGIRRLMLHASQFGVTMPSGKYEQFFAPLPEDFVSVLTTARVIV